MNHLSIKTPMRAPAIKAGPIDGAVGLPGVPVLPPALAGRRRALPPLAISLACLLAALGVARHGAGQLEAGAPDAAQCPLRAERFFVREAVASQDRMEASYFVLLHNPGQRAVAYGLHFDHAAAFDARSGGRATLPGGGSLPVLLGREILPLGAQPLSAERIAEAMRLSCRG